MASTRFTLHGPLAEKYRIEREIGRGGMATVYLAEDIRHSRPVAVKVLSAEIAAVAGHDRFLQEVQILARLNHPNILPLHDSGVSDDVPCYITPFIEGESLRQRMTRDGALPVEDVLGIARDVCGALQYAHARGVVHRDIKPENILLTAGHAVLADFGIARAVDNATISRLTSTGLTLGTPGYMSPEQATGAEVDARSDLYSLGCLLYEALTGETPFPASTPAHSIARRLTEDAPSARARRPAIPPRLDEAIQRCMARTPGDRFSSAEELLRTLSPADSGAHLWGKPASRTSLRAPVIGGAVAVALVAAGVFAFRALTTPTLGTDRLVVFPFTVVGDAALDYLGEGMVDLLARNLDGVQGLRTVDPGTVLTAVASYAGRAMDERGYHTVAGRVGGGAYVSGSVSAVGGQVRMQARWRSLNGDGSGEAPVISAEGTASDVLAVVDQLAARLLVSRGRDGGRLVESAAVTTNSLDALKTFVTAEQILRRGPQFVDSAIATFQRAVQIDSTFALAYYRLAVAADWNGRRAIAAQASRKAIATAGRLADRDRRLLQAYADFRSGAADSAEARYREILRDYPDDIEAQFQLADLMTAYNPLRGRPLDEPRQIFERVLAYDPGFL